MNEGIRYMVDVEESGASVHRSPEQLRKNSHRYYKNWIFRHFYGGRVNVMSIGHEKSIPGKAIVDRIMPYRTILHYVVSGTGTFNGIPISKGQGFISWAKEKHTIESSKSDPMEFYWIDIYGDEVISFLKEAGISTAVSFFDFDWIDKIKSICDDVIYNDYSNTEISYIMDSVLRIAMAYHKFKNSGIEQGESQNQRQKHVEKAMQYIHDNLNTVTVASLGEHFNLSSKYLSKLFYQYRKCSVQTYIIMTKMNIAADMFHNLEMPVKEIAINVGYTDYAQFSKIFKKYKGVSPYEFRKRNMLT